MTLKQDFIEALRSGKFRQTVEVLRSKDEGGIAYCANGILGCVMAIRSGKDHEDTEIFWEAADSMLMTIPNSTFVRIAEMNDAGFSFGEIAEFVENRIDENLVIQPKTIARTLVAVA